MEGWTSSYSDGILNLSPSLSDSLPVSLRVFTTLINYALLFSPLLHLPPSFHPILKIELWTGGSLGRAERWFIEQFAPALIYWGSLFCICPHINKSWRLRGADRQDCGEGGRSYARAPGKWVSNRHSGEMWMDVNSALMQSWADVLGCLDRCVARPMTY